VLSLPSTVRVMNLCHTGVGDTNPGSWLSVFNFGVLISISESLVYEDGKQRHWTGTYGGVQDPAGL
jgi:hypothetical protein